MAVQSNFSETGGPPISGTCTFLLAQAAGNTNVVMASSASFGNLDPVSIADTSLNAYVLVLDYEIAGQFQWVWVADDIHAAAPGGNVVTVTMAGEGFDQDLFIFLAEEPPTTGVRASNAADNFGTDPTVNLAGTVAGDVVVSLAVSETGGISIAGLVGTNPATLLQVIPPIPVPAGIFQDGASSGGAIDVTSMVPFDAWFITAVALVPGAAGPPPDPLFFGTNA